MKVKFIKLITIGFSIIFLILLYLSFIGIETDKFNDQIIKKINEKDKRLNLSLQRIKLTLDPLNLKLDAKTIGAIIYYDNKPIELEYIKTKVSLNSLITNKLVSSQIEIATKSVFLKNLVEFIRATSNRPELFILETFIRKGNVILDLNLNFDEKGNIKNDYELRGILKDGKIKFLKNNEIENINFIFNIKKNNYLIEDLKLTTDDVNFYLNLLKINKKNDNYLFDGQIKNKDSVLSNKLLKMLNYNFKEFNIKDSTFSSSNDFKFELTNKFKVKNLSIKSDIEFDQIEYKNNLGLSDYFNDIPETVSLKNHNLKLKYQNDLLSVEGQGQIQIGKNYEKINYELNKKGKKYDFNTNFNVKNIDLKNQDFIKNYFPLLKDQFNLKNHKINIKYKNEKLVLNGEGGIKIDRGYDKLNYSLSKNNNDYEFKSSLNLKSIDLKNEAYLKNFFPEIKNFSKLKDHKINFKIKKNLFTISGEGKIKIHKVFEDIDYFVLNKDGDTNFDLNIALTNTDFNINEIKFKKNKKKITKLFTSGNLNKKQTLNLYKISLKEEDQNIQINNLVLGKNYLINKFEKATFDYSDIENKENQFVIQRDEKNNYRLNGLFFNANSLIESLLKDKQSNNKIKIFNNDITLNINLNEVNLDEVYILKNLQGLVIIKDNKVFNANLDANFGNNKNITFSINTNNNGQKITKLYSSKAKPFVNKYKFIKGFEEGDLELNSIKQNSKSITNLKINNFKLKEVPTLTKLLTLASLQGIADILTGEGIRFDEFEMKFNSEKDMMLIDEIYAIGPAISILMNGYIEQDKLISLRGTLVPATTINNTISKIPLLGKILVGDKTGEGVFGVSFKIKGPPKDLKTTVNPIKTLTPRFITRTLDKLKKN